jgi:hypothetical protein
MMQRMGVTDVEFGESRVSEYGQQYKGRLPHLI